MQPSTRYVFNLSDLTDLGIRVAIYLAPIALANENTIAMYLSSHGASPAVIAIIISVIADFAHRFCSDNTVQISTVTENQIPTI